MDAKLTNEEKALAFEYMLDREHHMIFFHHVQGDPKVWSILQKIRPEEIQNPAWVDLEAYWEGQT